MQKIAIIGASSGQQKLCAKAAELGLYTIGFAWEKTDEMYKNMFSKFYPISITDMDKIVDVCKEEHINGVVSNASDLTAKVVSYVSSKIGLNGNNYPDFIKAENKLYVRHKTNAIPGITPVKAKLITSEQDMFFPCVVKPCVGYGKRGVCFVGNKEAAHDAFEYASQYGEDIFIEEFIPGKEYSIESISFNGRHQIVQITEKLISGAPHFVELGHTQPANIAESVKQKLDILIPQILDSLNFRNGASHIEIKIDTETENIFLIEANLRGGGDEISNTLVGLSTNFDYIEAIILVALDKFIFPKEIKNTENIGICYLCKQSQMHIKKILENSDNILINNVKDCVLTESKTNYDRQGYIIYKL